MTAKRIGQLEKVKKIFEPYGTKFYYAELTASQEVRLELNKSENRLKNKPSKRDIDSSNMLLINDDIRFRYESFDGEIGFNNYFKMTIPIFHHMKRQG